MCHIQDYNAEHLFFLVMDFGSSVFHCKLVYLSGQRACWDLGSPRTGKWTGWLRLLGTPGVMEAIQDLLKVYPSWLKFWGL
ncbi:hypothetical protein AVEN_243396-1 [Araneus ventricosus]|uniref:Uncharacterized protein n=1 Tax=Araneus ventricosus TaxID=182803 RepID=A0A4Y2SI56_ARAVE|nr:hypothetical protein AVEN_243396-1 [Araneus ventricosus]